MLSNLLFLDLNGENRRYSCSSLISADAEIRTCFGRFFTITRDILQGSEKASRSFNCLSIQAYQWDSSTSIYRREETFSKYFGRSRMPIQYPAISFVRSSQQWEDAIRFADKTCSSFENWIHSIEYWCISVRMIWSFRIKLLKMSLDDVYGTALVNITFD